MARLSAAASRGDPADLLREYFAELGWQVVEPTRGTVNWAYEGATGRWYGQTWWLGDTEHLLGYGTCADPVPANRRARLTKFANGVNTDLVAGAFEVDSALRFRLGVPVAAAAVSPDLIDRMVATVVATVERYRPAAMELLA
jgi:hypothetical protein